MKCQSFWLLDPSRRSLTVVSVTGRAVAGAALAGAGGGVTGGPPGDPGGGISPCAIAGAAADTHTSRKTRRTRFNIRPRWRRSRSVSRPAEVLDDVAEQKDRSGDDDLRRSAPCGI